MTDNVQVKMDRGAYYSTVHGERAPDDDHAATAFMQDGIPFDGEGIMIADHAVFELRRGQNCSRNAARLRAKAAALIEEEKRRMKRRAEKAALKGKGQNRRTAPERRPAAEEPFTAPPMPSDLLGTTAPAPAPAEAPRRIVPPPPDGNELPPGDNPADQSDLTDLDEDEEDEDEDEDEDDDDEDDDANPKPDEDGYVHIDLAKVLKGEQKVQWFILSQDIAAKHGRRVTNMAQAVQFLVVEDDGPHLIPRGLVAKQYQKFLA